MKSTRAWVVAIVVLLVLGAVAFVAYGYLSPKIAEAQARKVMAAMRADLPIGITRAEAYERIKAHHLIAYNGVYQTIKNFPPGCIPVRNPNCQSMMTNAGEFPNPTDPALHEEWSAWTKFDVMHPYVIINYPTGSSMHCDYSAFQKIDFDKRDRVASVTDMPVTSKCI